MARARNITDTAHLHFVRETAASTLIDEEGVYVLRCATQWTCQFVSCGTTQAG